MKTLNLLISFLFACGFLFAQETKPPYYDDIQAFKKQDSIRLPPKNAILFVGSSSFTNWKDVQDYFPKHKIINRGFGGSTLEDVIRYADNVIIPYHPKQIVIYCGENDLAYADSVTAQMVFSRFKQLLSIIRKNYPAVQVAYISIKPSPSRMYLWEKMKEANNRIKNYISTRKNVAFINVWNKMFSSDGIIKKEIFVEDELHMNAKGYRIWQKLIEPYLVKTNK